MYSPNQITIRNRFTNHITIESSDELFEIIQLLAEIDSFQVEEDV